MVALGFALIVGVPFALGVGAMTLRVPRLVKLGVAVAPAAGFALLVVSGAFWLGDMGAPLILLIALWGWLLGVGMSRDMRWVLRRVACVQRV